MQLTNMLVVSNALPAKTVQEFIDYCKANPGKISFASSGNGTSVHMSAELFKAMTKCDMVHVPYRGSAIAIPDIISNKVQLIFDNLPSALEQVSGGNVRALGVTSPQRWPSVPDIPAIAETVPGFESVGFYGISAPKGTPPEIIEILNKAVGEALKDPKLVARLAEIGGIPKPMTPGRVRQAGHRRDREVAQGGGVCRGVGGLGLWNCRAPAARQRDIGGDRKTPPNKMCENNPMHSRKIQRSQGVTEFEKTDPLARLPEGGGEGSARRACAVGQNRTIRASSPISVIQKSQTLPRRRFQPPEPALHPRLRPCKRTAHRCRPQLSRPSRGGACSSMVRAGRS